MPRKICIVGTTPTRGMAPFNDSSWEIWTIGPGGRDVPGHRWDRLYEIHGAGHNHTWPEDFASYLDFLSKIEPPKQVVTIRPIAEMIQDWSVNHGKTQEQTKALVTGQWEASVVLDKPGLMQKYKKMWMSSSFSWAIAQAIEEQATHIGVYGVDLEAGEEYVSQFAGARHLLDLAEYIGIEIVTPPFCGLLRDPAPYPDRWETYEALWFQNRITMLTNLASHKQAEMDAIRANMHRREGAVRTLEDIALNYTGQVQTESAEAAKALVQENAKAASALQHTAADLSHLNGQLATAKLYMEHFVFTGMTGIQT